MSTRKIKIVKRNTPKPIPEPKQPIDTDRNISNTVKTWISERQKNGFTPNASTRTK